MNLKKTIALTVASVAFAMAQETVQPAAQPVAQPAAQPAAEPAAAPQPAEAPQPATQVAEPAEAPVLAEQPAAPVAEPAAAPAPAEVAQPTAPVAEPAETPQETTPVAKPVEAAQPEAKAAASTEQGQSEPAVAAVPPQGPEGAPEGVRMGPPKTPFTVLHGNAYNRVGNEAAGDNVDALLNKRLTKMAFNKFFYVEPSGEKGAFSLGGFFGAMDISGELGRATAGYATPVFAAELRLGLGQVKVDNDKTEIKKTVAGDDWGATLSANIGGYTVTLAGDWVTYAEETNVDPKRGANTEERYRDLNASLILTDGPSAQTHFWSAGVAFNRHEEEVEKGGVLVGDDTLRTNFSIVPVFNYGTPVLRAPYANLYMGVNASVPVTIYDDRDIRDEKGDMVETSEYTVGVKLAPNILGEVLLTESLMLFGEANYDWEVYRYVKHEGLGGDNTLQRSVSDKVEASMGFRYQYKNWAACEFAFGDSFFTDTKSIFNGEGVFITFGGFIYF